MKNHNHKHIRGLPNDNDNDDNDNNGDNDGDNDGGDYYYCDGDNKEDPTVTYTRMMQEKRDRRRNAASTFRHERHIENLRNIAEGRPGDVDFQRLVKAFRRHAERIRTSNSVRTFDGDGKHGSSSRCKIFCRKRPVNDMERNESDYDVVTVMNDTTVVVHFPKMHYDGVTKSIENAPFQFHRVFNGSTTNKQVYDSVCGPLVQRCLSSGEPGLLFATGQTGSGKTYSLRACLELMAREVFGSGIETVMIQSFEVYGNTILDLLQGGSAEDRRVHARSKGRVHSSGSSDGGGMAMQGLRGVEVKSVREFLKFMANAQRRRKTSATKKNSNSSRSHWIVNLVLQSSTSLVPLPSSKSTGRQRRSSKIMRILSIVDLAGSERHDDSSDHTPELMRESSKINQSLLSLKKVIKALSDMEIGEGCGSSAKTVKSEKAKLLHVFRGSKLTMVLRSFLLHPKCRVHVLCTVAPTASCAHHSVDTLRNATQLQPKMKIDIHLSTFEQLEESSSLSQSPQSPQPPPQPPQLPQPSPPMKPSSATGFKKKTSPRKKKELMSLKSKLRLKLTGLDPQTNDHTNTTNNTNHHRPTHRQWKGLSPTARSAAAASAQTRFAQANTTMPAVHQPKPTPLLRSHGSMLMMLDKSPVLVAVRVRPLSSMEKKRHETVALRVSSKSTLSLDLPATGQRDTSSRIFSFDSCVHSNATQHETFKCTGHLLLGKVLSGVNACLFCYGQTGAGKTHTLIGSQTDRGVLLEFVREMFTKLDPTQSSVKVTMMEIFKEKLRDLLDPTRKPGIVGSKKGGVHVQNVHVAEINSSVDMERILWQGLARRVTGSTDMNKRSSRSHAVITLYVTQRNVDGYVLRSKISFVDLAGSERQERSGAAGKRLKEAASINKSLSALGNVILALVQSSDHIPYRSSVLTYVCCCLMLLFLVFLV